MTRIGNFFRKIGRGIKKGFHAVVNVGKKIVKPVLNIARPVLGNVVKKVVPGIISKVVPGGGIVTGALKGVTDKIGDTIAGNS